MCNLDFEFRKERRKFEGRPAATIKIPEKKPGSCFKAPESSILVSIIENDIWIIESIENDYFICREPSVKELIRIQEYSENPYINQASPDPL